jgi:hypothetical protein
VIAASNWVPDGTADQGRSNPELKNFREAAAALGLTVVAVADVEPGTFEVQFASFPDAWRLAVWARDAGMRLTVEGPVGFAALRAWRRESGLYAIRLHLTELPELTARLLDPVEDWGAFPGRFGTVWARWSR